MTGIEQRRRDLMRDQPDLYDYIETLTEARTYKVAGDLASGATDGHGAANRCYRRAASYARRSAEMRADQ